jgi:atypical dual specificity phosphatase
MERFYWVQEAELAGCSCPGGMRDGADPSGDLEWLRERQIGALLTLTEEPLDETRVAGKGLATLHVPVTDMTAPTPDQFMRALDFIDDQRSQGRAVAVHCLMGQGRTATILAAYLIRNGVSANEAIARLRARCPGAIASREQEAALQAFARRADWIV